MSDYTAFLRAKIKMANFAGFNIEPEGTHPILFHQQVSMPSLFDVLEEAA